LTAPDMQMVVVPATRTNATTDIAKVSFTVLPSGKVLKKRANRLEFAKKWKGLRQIRVNASFPMLKWSIGQLSSALNLNLIATRKWL
jgi:hypothetical protein